MIFYFTGTGNSLFAAKRLLNKNEKLINIAEAMHKSEYEYKAEDNEAVAFIFPVYFYTIPSIVSEFISKIKIDNASYIYAVITCGGSIHQAGSILKKLLKQNDLTLNYVSELLMPDNSMLFYQIPPISKASKRLEKAEIRLKEIQRDISNRTEIQINDFTLISDIVSLGYKWSNKTAKFYADKNCIACGLCQIICPEKAIMIKDGKPEWTKESCSKCSACINRCPKEAIQYGSLTKRRNRYRNPIVFK